MIMLYRIFLSYPSIDFQSICKGFSYVPVSLLPHHTENRGETLPFLSNKVFSLGTIDCSVFYIEIL